MKMTDAQLQHTMVMLYNLHCFPGEVSGMSMVDSNGDVVMIASANSDQTWEVILRNTRKIRHASEYKAKHRV